MRINPANAITIGRIALAPVLLLLAWRGDAHAFLAGLIVALVSDIVDGQIARRLGHATPLGAKLDSWADFAIYATVPFAVVWLLPDFVARRRTELFVTIASYLVPVALGFAKFRALTSYHTLLARVAAYLMGAAAVVLFAHGPDAPFLVALAVLVVAELEEIAITLVLPSPRSNIHSLARVLRSLRKEAAARKAGGPEPGG